VLEDIGCSDLFDEILKLGGKEEGLPNNMIFMNLFVRVPVN